MFRQALLLAAVAGSLAVTACNDSRTDPTAPATATPPVAPLLSATPTPTLDQDINSLITQLFPTRLQPFVVASWNAIKLEVAKNPKGKPTAQLKLALNALVAYMKANETQLINVLGETRQHALVRLVLDMLLYVFYGPTTPTPTMAPTGDVGLGTVQPTSTTATTVTTPTKHAAVQFPAGAVSEPTTVIVTQDNTPYPANCSGPMTTRRCQYPQFYKVNVFPDVKLVKPAKVAVCHVNAGNNRKPLRGGEFHDRFRLAHDRPVNTADQMPGATEEDGVEILPLIHVDPTVMDCTSGDTYGAFMRTRPGAFGEAIDRAQWMAGRLAFGLKHLFIPKDLHAIDQGGGGETMFFSSFADIDPQSAPDLAPGAFTVQETELFAGETAHITALSVTNVGTGSVGPTTTSIRLSSDTAITTADAELASQPTIALVPNDVAAGAPLTVTIPANTPPGTYYLGVLTDAANVATEENESNNYVSVRFTVKRLVSTTTVNCPTSVAYTGTAQTPCTATVTGTGLNLTPTPAYTNNTSVGTATATYNYLGDATYAPSTASKTFQISQVATTTTIACPPSVVYTGNAQTPCTATVTGPGLETAVAPAYTNNTNAGAGTATANYAGDANYAASSASKNFQIAQAPTTTALACPTSATYTGVPITCTATTTGPGTPGAPPITYTNNTNAGQATATATFAATTNYLTSTDTKTFTIGPAATTTDITCTSPVTFTGSAQTPCAGTSYVTGNPNNVVGAPTLAYSNNTNAGTATVLATLAASGNYAGSFQTRQFVINPAATTTAVICPATANYTGSPVTPCSASTTGPGLSTTPPIAYANNTNLGTATATATYSAAGNYLGSTDTKSFQITVPAGSLTISPASVEKLPGGTQTFSVASGGPGPYTWSVNGVNGGDANFGTITSGGAYTAPAAVPTPATFNVCATMQSPPQNTGCASVTIKPIPSTGGEVIVFNDENMFDNTYGTPYANNPQFYRNLVQFTAPGSRASQTGVLMHRGHNSVCGSTECSESAQSGFRTVLTTAGFSITDVDDPSATITAIPASIKVIFLWMPVTPYSNGEINALKQFASEGGRLIFVGEHAGYYGTNGINTENAFFASMGAQMTNQGGFYDCGHVDLPASSLRSHQITTGLTGLAIACASQVIPGPNDYPLFYDHTNTIVLAAVAKVDLTPISAAMMAARVNRIPLLPRKNDAGTVQYTGWSATPISNP